MNKKEMTFRIIKQLNRSEKRLFRMEITKFKNSTYILLYDFFDTQKKFDEQKFDAYCTKRKIQNPSIHISQLFKKLIDFCLQYREAFNKDKIKQKIQLTNRKAALYKDLGFMEYAAKEFKKALKLADQHKRYWLMPESMVSLFSMASQLEQQMTLEDNVFSDNMPLAPHERMEWAVKKMTHIFVNRIAYTELFNVNYILRPSPEKDKAINELLDFEPLPFEKDDFFAFSGYYFVKQEQAFAKNDLRLHKQVLEELLEGLVNYYAEGSHLILQYYASMKYIFCKTLFWLEPEKFLTQSRDYLSTIENIEDKYEIPRTPHIMALNSYRYDFLRLKALFLKTDLHADDIKYFVPIKEKFTVWGEKASYKNELALAVLLFVIIREYKESDNCYKRLSPLLAKINIDVQIAAELEVLEVIKAFEKNDEYYAAQLIKKIKNKIYKGHAIPEINQLLLSLIRKMQKLDDKQQHIELLKENLPKLLQLEQSTSLKFLPFSYWMKKRIEEDSILL